MENVFKNLHTNQKILIYELLKRGIYVEVIDEKLELIKATFKDHQELIYDRDSSITPYHVSVLAGNKGIAKRILSQNGVSVPLGEVFKAKDRTSIIKAFELLDGPVVLKPVHGSHGYDVYLNLKKIEEIESILCILEEKYGSEAPILIEEFFDAKEYRVFLTKAFKYAVLHRDPAYIIGDGIHTIDELIEIENDRRMHPRTNALCEILIDNEMDRYLKENGISRDFIPTLGKKVYVRRNSNVAMGGVCVDKTDEVDRSVIEIGKRVLDSFPGLPYVGIDFMTKDISLVQTEDSYRVIEVNTVPGLQMHHRPAIGKSQNVASYIVDLMFPETVKSEVSYGKQRIK